MTATDQPTWDTRIEPAALPAPRPLLAAAPPPEVWAPPPPELAAEEPAEAPPPALIIVRERLQSKGTAAGPQAKQRIVTLAVPGELYEGFEFEAWANPPFSIVHRFQSEDVVARVQSLTVLVLATNKWHNPAGEPYPEPTDPGFWDGPNCIPIDLMLLMIESIAELLTRNPNSRRARRAS